jgi:hypothetical protein
VDRDVPEDVHLPGATLGFVPRNRITNTENLRKVSLRHHEHEAIGRAADQANDYGRVWTD